MSKKARRLATLVLMILGALLMFLATPSWVGAIVFGLGIVIELVGLTLRHEQQSAPPE